jgi:hypothetical protein
MKHIVRKLGIPGIVLAFCALPAALAAQAFSTTTVQGTVYLANGAPGSGTLQLSWPAFTTAASQAVAAGRMVATIGADGFLSVNLSPNAGASPAGLYYTAVYHLSDGTTSTEYWVVPASAQATIAQVRATVMPAAQAVQAVSKTYVDQAVLQAAQSQLTASGGNLTGPLYLNGDPGSPTQAATKHYVDNQFSQALSVNGGAANGPLTATQLGAIYQADQFTGADFGAKLQACLNALNSTYGGTCDARNFTGTLGMAANLTINKANVTVNLPCATISTASQIVVTAGTRNVTLHGCASRGTTAASGNQGGTVILYSGNRAAIQAGDATYAADTLGFHLDNVVINTTNSTAATAQAIAVLRMQELHLEALYLLGNANQTGITLDGTGNYTGGTLTDVEVGGFQAAINGIGHQVANPAPTDWVNASTFVRLHIDCPTTNGNPIAGTTGINLLQGDGNMFSGGDVEGCATALHLGPNAQNNTIVGLRNENSTYQVVADAGSAYNNWMTGGTMFTGRLTDNGTRNSFLDTFHRSFNGINGDWYGSQQDATLMNHYRLGIGNGNERGLQNRYQTDYGYRWTTGLTDATAGEQFYQVLDELNNVNRISVGQYNNGQSSTNNQTVINAAGTGAIVLNGSNNAGSGGVLFGSGGPASTTVATINNTGNAQFNGTLQVGGATTFIGSPSVKNQADAEIDYFLQAGATAPQKESVIYKDWNGASQWYLVKDTSNNWALNSAVGGVDSFKAYQSTNSGDTYIDAANNTGVVRVNYEPGSGSAFNVYGGSGANLYASFNGTTGIKFPGLAASSGHNCVQIDNSGYLSNTGAACAGSSVGAGTAGQVAYYPGNGSTLAGMAAVPVTAGGTGATSAGAALTSLGGLALSGGTLNGPLTLSGDPTVNLQAATKQYVDAAFNGSANDATARSSAAAAQATANAAQVADQNCKPDGAGNLTCKAMTAGIVAAGASIQTGGMNVVAAVGAAHNGVTDDTTAIQGAINQATAGTAPILIPLWNNVFSGSFTYPANHAPITFAIYGNVKQSGTIALDSNTSWVCGTPNCTIDATSVASGSYAMFGAGSFGTPISVTSDIPLGSNTVVLSSATGLTAGEWGLLTSNEYFKNLGTGTCSGPYCKGEMVQIQSISSNTLTLYSPTFDSYTAANGAVFTPETPIQNVTLNGFTLTRLAQNTAADDCLQINYGLNITLKNLTFNNCTEASTRFLFATNLMIDGITIYGNWYSGTGTSYGISIGDASQFVNISNVHASGVRHAVTMNSDSSHGTTRMVTVNNVNVDETQPVVNGACVDAHENSQYINYMGLTCRAANQTASWCATIRGYNSSLSNFNCYGAGGVDLANNAWDTTYNRIGPGVVTIIPGSALAGVHINGSGNRVDGVHVVAASPATDTGTWNAFESVSQTTSGGVINSDNHFDHDSAEYPRSQGFYLYTDQNSTVTNWNILNGHGYGFQLTGRVADSAPTSGEIIGPGSMSTTSYGIYNASTFNTNNYYAGISCIPCTGGITGSAGGTPWAAGSGALPVMGPTTTPTNGDVATWSGGALVDGGAVPTSNVVYTSGDVTGQTGTVAYTTVYTTSAPGQYCFVNQSMYPTTANGAAWLASLYGKFVATVNGVAGSANRIYQADMNTGAQYTSPTFCAWVPASTPLQVGVFTDSGSRGAAVFSYSVQIVKIQ